MLTDSEQRFLDYWQKNRKKEGTLVKQLLPGFILGAAIGAGILFMLDWGWYTRATMVASSQMSPVILLICFILIAAFISVFYKRHKWEMNEQHYKELLVKKEKEISSTPSS